ncbi:ABC transporter permease [Nocardioides piscis]|uniref:ABC transporter permease n=2 Tax=Nocardioides piscis TaxID=2714938 RepID=A0A6G7YKZ1_9ACTN|nr:ABC transporter permease [Nocardioides piscis]
MVALIPGDPAVAILGDGKPPEQYDALRQELGLNDPVIQRYLDWLAGAVRGDLGSSIMPPQTPVAERLLAALPVSLQLAAMGLAIALVISIPLALWSAARQGGLVDRVIGASMFGLLSIPSFLAGLLLIMFVVNDQGWFPRSQWVRISDSLAGNLHHAILPAIVIALSEIALFTRILRNDLVVTLQEDFVLAARAKGQPPWRIMVGDALRPSSFSLVTLFGISTGRLIGSTVIVEYLFALPGMGSLVVSGAQTGNFPVVQGAVLVTALIYVVVNSCVDLSYGILDPRTRRVHA